MIKVTDEMLVIARNIESGLMCGSEKQLLLALTLIIELHEANKPNNEPINIEVTNEMRELLQKYSEGFVSENAAAKRIIELHEANKPKLYA
jgi:hypothetical protein